eukprot:COSAG03_NODE_521_length_7208_cov_11.258264_11_plen_70_part_00
MPEEAAVQCRAIGAHTCSRHRRPHARFFFFLLPTPNLGTTQGNRRPPRDARVPAARYTSCMLAVAVTSM